MEILNISSGEMYGKDEHEMCLELELQTCRDLLQIQCKVTRNIFLELNSVCSLSCSCSSTWWVLTYLLHTCIVGEQLFLFMMFCTQKMLPVHFCSHLMVKRVLLSRRFFLEFWRCFTSYLELVVSSIQQIKRRTHQKWCVIVFS